MDCKKRRYYTYELKKEIIQKLKDGIKRSDIQKEYGISPSSLSRWICPPDKIIGEANDETVRDHPIQPAPEENKDDDDDDSVAEIGNDNGDDDDSDDNNDDDDDVSHKKRKRDDDDDDDEDDDVSHKKRRLNDDDDDDDDNDIEPDDNEEDEDAEDWNRLVNKYKVLRKKIPLRRRLEEAGE